MSGVLFEEMASASIASGASNNTNASQAKYPHPKITNFWRAESQKPRMWSKICEGANPRMKQSN